MQTLNQFICNCKHKECQRHAQLGVIDRNHMPFKNTGEHELNGSSIFLENVLDMSHTLAQIMILCGIHECKAKTAVDVITHSFLNYDLVCYCLETKPMKRLRKEDIFHELGSKCLMNRVEAYLCYNIIKRGFKAFYYLPQDDETEFEQNKKPSLTEECLYVHAAKKTAEYYGRFEGLSCDEFRGIEAKIKVVYKKFYDRLQLRKNNPAQENCNCCFCAKSRGHFVYSKPPPCTETTKAKKPHTYIHCFKRKKGRKFIHSQSTTNQCPICHRLRKYCTCPKYKFDINWVGSIWSRPDMQLYYEETIEQKTTGKLADALYQNCMGNMVPLPIPANQSDELAEKLYQNCMGNMVPLAK